MRRNIGTQLVALAVAVALTVLGIVVVSPPATAAGASMTVQALSQSSGNCGGGVAITDLGNCVTSVVSPVDQQFAVSLSNLAAGQTVKNVTATLTFTPSAGAILTMPALPSNCLTSNATPTSSVSGNLTLVCNLGNVSSAQIIAIDTVVEATGDSPSGSSFTTSIHAVAGDGTVPPSNTVTNPVITIKGKPAYTTNKTAGSVYEGVYTINGQSNQHGYELNYNIYGAPDVTVGGTYLTVPLNITDTLSKFPNAVVVACTGPDQWSNSNLTPLTACPSGAPAAGVNLQFKTLYQGAYGQTLTVFIPASDVYKDLDSAWVAGDPAPTGTANFSNCLSGLNGLKDAGGQLNNDTGVMAGNLCASSSITISPGGDGPKPKPFKHLVVNGADTLNGDFVYPNQLLDGAHLQYVNQGAAPDPNAYLCDAFDVSTMTLDKTQPANFTGIGIAAAVTPPAGYELEYAVGPNTTNTQVGALTPQHGYTVPVYDTAFTDQQANATSCRTYAGPWTTTPAATFGANWNTQVNMVRMVPIPGTSPAPAMAPNVTVDLYLRFNVLSTYNGGPNAGEPIPDGAYVPNVGSWDTYTNGVVGTGTQTAFVAFHSTSTSSTTGSKEVETAAAPITQMGVGNDQYAKAGQAVQSVVTYHNTGVGADPNFFLCDAWDVSTMQIDVAHPYNTGSFGTVVPGMPNGYSNNVPTGYEIEYAVGPNTTNTQVGAPTAKPGYTIPIYDDSAPAQQAGAGSCNSSPGPWTTTPATTFGANWNTQVNMIRMVAIPGTAVQPIPGGAWIGILPQLNVLATYNGGPNAGQSIPTGAYIPNVGSWNQVTNGVRSVGTQQVDVPFQAVTLGLAKSYDTSTNYQPGAQLKWLMTPSIQTGTPGNPVTGLSISDPLPANVVYDAACTQKGLPVGVTATYDAATTTVKFVYSQTFTVPAKLPADLTPSVTVCGRILSTTKPGTLLDNTATVTASEDPLDTPSNLSRVTVSGPGTLAISKTVSTPTIVSGTPYTWTLTWADTSQVAFQKPQIIDVLPYNGDGLPGLSQRSPQGSAFAGTNTLTGALPQPQYSPGSTDSGAVPGTWYYTTAASATINENPGAASNANPGTAGSIWVSAANISDFALVTGVYFASSAPIAANDVVTVPIQQVATTNKLGDLYVNQAGLWTASAPNNPIVSDDPFTQIPGIVIAKSANPTTVHAVGDLVTYTFVVSNHGQIPLTDVSVDDTQIAPAAQPGLSVITCQSLSSPAGSCSGTTVATLAAGQSATFTASYHAAQADVDHGSIHDSAVANGNAGPDAPVTSQPSTAVVTIPAAPSVALVKSVTSPAGSVSHVGDVVTYGFLVTNTGNVTLSGVAVADTQVAPAGVLTSGPTCPSATLAPAGTETCTATYTVTQADLDNGSINDTATASGTPPTGPPVTSPPSTAIVPATQTPTLTVIKSGDVSVAHAAGDVVHYSFLVTNTGNVTLHAIAIDDSFSAPAGPALTVTCPSSTLAPAGTETCTATYTATQADVDHGAIENSATASGTPPTGPPVTSPPSTWHVTIPAAPVTSPPPTAIVPLAQTPAITVIKSVISPRGLVTKVGTIVVYGFKVTNTGNVTLTNVHVSDVQQAPAGKLASGPHCPQSVLAPNASEMCTATYAVARADLHNGSINDTATATGRPPHGVRIVSPPSTVTVKTFEPPSTVVTKIDTGYAGPIKRGNGPLEALGVALLIGALGGAFSLRRTGRRQHGAAQGGQR